MFVNANVPVLVPFRHRVHGDTRPVDGVGRLRGERVGVVVACSGEAGEP